MAISPRIRMVVSVMNTYQVGAKEADMFLSNDCNKAFMFTNGRCYIPLHMNFNQN